jgi:hypothetical protein
MSGRRCDDFRVPLSLREREIPDPPLIGQRCSLLPRQGLALTAFRLLPFDTKQVVN